MKIGTFIALFLRSKVNKHDGPVQTDVMGPEVPQAEVEQRMIEFEGVKSLYDEIKLIEQSKNDDNNSEASALEVKLIKTII